MRLPHLLSFEGIRQIPRRLLHQQCIYMLTHEMWILLMMGQEKEVGCNWDLKIIFFNIERKT